MRQTSRAVALLLAVESANAVTAQVPPAVYVGGDYETVFDPTASASGAPTDSLALNSRTAGYTNAARTFAWGADGTSPSWILPTITYYRKATVATNVLAAASTISVATGGTGSGCMQCLNGGGVWCSRTFSYLSTSATNLFMVDGTTAASLSSVLPVSAAATVTGDALDGGSCCDSAVNFNSFVGTKAVPVQTIYSTSPTHTTSIDAAGLVMLPTSCPAIASTYTASSSSDNTNTWGAQTIDGSTTALSGWWCSNGLYKKVVASATVLLNSQQTITMAQNKRLELAQVGCPNAKIMCNHAEGTVAIELTNASASTMKRDIVMPLTTTNGFNSLSKCTWVTWSTVSGPSWTLKESTNVGLTGANWQIHAMEYTASTTTSFVSSNGSLVPGAAGGLTPANEALSFGNYAPHFAMPAEQFATLRTWYGEGALAINDITQQTSTWLSPGMAPISNTGLVSTQLLAVQSQLYGNVANVPVSGNVISADTTALTATQNYGKYNNVVFDLRQLRYFPAKVAQTVHAAGTTAAATYTTALTSYNTAKTTWDAYVAILTKNAKQDAFAAAFSPPKAPTVPPLPNKPWLPAAYSGYTRATAENVAGFTANNISAVAASPTASQFWTNLSAAQTVGGWGSFTASIFTYRNGWGKSFGTIGYDGTGAAMSDVWNYKWTCIATTNEVSTTSQCAPSYSITTAGGTANTPSAPAINTTKLISAVSLWSTAQSATSATKFGWGTTVNGFAITFTAGAWTSGIVGLAPIAAPTAAVAASSLSGIAGAQALVASSAAALAVAAALY